MPRQQPISKYCVVRRPLAFASSKVYAKLIPSIGFGGVPLSTFGGVMPITSYRVGTISTVWRNCSRRPPLSLIRAGHETTIGLRVPPKWLATCLVHWNGVFIACAHAEGKWLKYFGPP